MDTPRGLNCGDQNIGLYGGMMRIAEEDIQMSKAGYPIRSMWTEDPVFNTDGGAGRVRSCARMAGVSGTVLGA